jgi:uncharacterized membrane protein (DUF2068 family)
MREHRGSGVLLVIALFKLLKAMVLIALGAGALTLVHDPDTTSTLRHAVASWRVDPDNRLIHGAIARVSGLDARRLEELSLGTFVYAGVFLAEGAGLLLRRRWAEYLTCLVTASFIPIEIYEMAQHASVAKGLGIAFNTAIVGYLARRLWVARGS